MTLMAFIDSDVEAIYFILRKWGSLLDACSPQHNDNPLILLILVGASEFGWSEIKTDDTCIRNT
jgi:hypothetical protein